MISQITRRVKVLAEGFEALEVARTKFDAIELAEAVKIVERAMIDIHNLIFSKPVEPATQDDSYLTTHPSNTDGLGKKDKYPDLADGTKKIVKSCPICRGKVWWCADCLTEMEKPDPEQCTIYRELERGFASKEKFAEVLGSGCWYCAYFSKVYCKTGETKQIGWDEIDEKEIEHKDLIWIEINENIRYAYDEENEVFILQHKKDGRFQTLKKFKYEDLKKIWDALPDEATVSDIRSAAKDVGVNTSNLENYLIRIFTHVKFGGDLTSSNRKIGRPCMVLIKNPEGDISLAEENRRRLEQEREMIGPMYSP